MVQATRRRSCRAACTPALPSSGAARHLLPAGEGQLRGDDAGWLSCRASRVHGFSLSTGRGCRRRVRDGSGDSLPSAPGRARQSARRRFPHPALRATFSRREKDSCGAMTRGGCHAEPSVHRDFSLSTGRGCRRRVRDGSGNSPSSAPGHARQSARRRFPHPAQGATFSQWKKAGVALNKKPRAAGRAGLLVLRIA